MTTFDSEFKLLGDDFFRRIVNAIPSMVWISRSDGYADFFSEQWLNVTGQTRERSHGMGWLDVVHPDDRPRLLRSIGPPLHGKHRFEIELRYRVKSGRYRWYMIRALRSNSSDVIDQWFGISVDIEDIHASEEMFEAQTRAIVDTAVDAIITINAEGIVQFVNPAVEKIFGYSESEVVGHNISMLMPEPDRSRHDSYITNYLRSGHKKIIGIGREVVGRRKDGTTFPMDLAVSELKLSDRRMFTGMIRDISERKRAEAEIRESQQRLSLVLEASQTIIYDCDLASGTYSWNDRYTEIFGLRDDPSIQWWRERLHPEDAARITSSLQDAIDGGDDRWGADYRLRKPDGSYADVLDRAHIARDYSGAATRISGSILDVTEVRRVRRQLVQAERLAAMGQMLSGIAHESRNALQRIQAGADMLALEINEQSEAREDLNRIIRAREDLNRLFEELRSYAAPIHLELGQHDLSHCWRQAWNHLETVRGGRCAELVEQGDGIQLACRIDQFRIEQVFRNLLENSLAACGDPVQIDICCRKSTLRQQPAVTVLIADNGPGLTAEQRQKVFDAFFTTKTKGSGLGMAIARRIIEAHQGTIRTLDPRDWEAAVANRGGAGLSEESSGGAPSQVSRPRGAIFEITIPLQPPMPA